MHGKYEPYKRIIKHHRDTIQVGDMGVGFYHPIAEDDLGRPKPLANPPYDHMVKGNHRFIRGNHDNPNVCRQQKMWIPDGTVESDVMFVGGATSIDKEYRIIGRTWWPDEELNMNELRLIADVYRTALPRVMVTHEAPQVIADTILAAFNRVKFNDASATRQALQVMLEHHRPDIWIFGHWHVSFDKMIDGTRFVCLAELEAKEINIGL